MLDLSVDVNVQSQLKYFEKLDKICVGRSFFSSHRFPDLRTRRILDVFPLVKKLLVERIK